MRLVIILGVVSTLLFSSCSEYQKLLKSTDYDLKYERALAYYEKGDYTRASTLFNGLISIFRGSEKSETSHYVFADCLYNLRDYMVAGHYFQLFVQNYPSSDRIEDAHYMSAYCSYKMSAKPRLDQADTYKALDQFQLFINLYPTHEKAEEASRLMDELRDKLVYKAYLNAKLYYNLGTYMGNNYQSAVVAASNVLDEYPDTKYREELSYLILDSKYIQAINSVEEKMDERLRDTLDEYYSFINEFPESQYLKNANKIFEVTTGMLN